jgi:hypothetical protein
MDWIKRNLYFLIGALVAVALMGWAGFYLYSKLNLNNETLNQLNEQYAKLDQLNKQKPHPGSGKVDNIAEAKRQQQQLTDLIRKIRTQFTPIPAIPETPKVDSQDFTAALRRTIDYLQRTATNSSVILPPNYSFSFEAQKPRVSFAPVSLGPLSVQLGEVKAICEVLFAAKVNALDNLRRERVSPDDSGGPATDYTDRKSVTNELAVMAPYEVSFRSFSTELAAVLAGFAGASNGILVKTINVEPASSSALSADPMGTPAPYGAPPGYVPPVMNPESRAGIDAETAMMARRYGIGGGGGAPTMGTLGGAGGMPGGAPPMMGELGGAGGGLGGVPLRTPTPGYAQPYAVPPGTAPGYGQPGAAAAARGGLPTVLDERLLKVTLTLDVVKLMTPKSGGDTAAAAPQPNPPNQ